MEDTQGCTKKTTRMLITVKLKTHINSNANMSHSESEQATTSGQQGAVMQPMADGETCPSLPGCIPRVSPQPSLSSGASKTPKRQDKQIAQIVAASKNGDGKARTKTPDSSKSHGLLSEVSSLEPTSATYPKYPISSNAQSANANTGSGLNTKHVVNSMLNANVDLVKRQTVTDSSIGMAPRGGVSWDGVNWVPVGPPVMTVAMSEPLLKATMSPGAPDGSMCPKNTSSCRNVRIPFLLTNTSAVSSEAIPPLIQAATDLLPTQNDQLCNKTSAKAVKGREVTSTLLIQDNQPSVKPSAKATMAPVIMPPSIQDNQPSVKPSFIAVKAQKSMGVARAPEVTVAGSIMTTSPSREDGKVQSFHKTQLGKRHDDDVLPIAKVSYHRLEPGIRMGYRIMEVSLAYDVQRALKQYKTNAVRVHSNVVIKRWGTIQTRNIQQRRNPGVPELERFKPRNVTRRKGTIYSDDLQQTPGQRVPPLQLPATPRLKCSISNEQNEKQKMHHPKPVSTMKTEGRREFMDSLGVSRVEDLERMAPDEPLTDSVCDETIAQRQKMTSPYLKRPGLYIAYNPSSSRQAFLRVKEGHSESAKTWKMAEIMDPIRQLSVKHPGMKTEEMMTPVKVKVTMTTKERNQLTYNEIDMITRKSKSGLKVCLLALTQLKRRDTRNHWLSLQYLVHNQKDFLQTFTAYSWSWSGCCNTMEIRDMDALYRPTPCLPCSQSTETTDIKQHTSSNQHSRKV
ncbi:hypothetical protein DPEC_G00277740 [Dallia pectoralis]|uniref:Uncharacterized protein n=1 Tax=Dallia pectoralis TaxID=75939 RepID=A0ACC2FLP8_DALPE|nr:hypothetical protein DPEC_G00277740 [Dallia pectoralis]